MESKIIRPKSNIMLDSASEIDVVCSELKRLGITFFSHTRIFNNGSRIDINNNALMIEEFYYGKDKIYEFYTPEINPKERQEDILLVDSLEDNPSFQFLRNGYNIDHMLVKIEKQEAFCDVWNFGTKKENKDITRLYLNHLDVLILFTYYYREKCANLIRESEKDPIIISDIKFNDKDLDKFNMTAEQVKDCLLSKTKRYYLNSFQMEPVYLTKSEIEICLWIYRGKTSEEIAVVLGGTKRTIEKHIENIKRKFFCENKGQLILKLKSLGIFSHNNP